MRVLVTGASGFIGSHVSDTLNSMAHFAIGLDLKKSKWAYECDIRDFDSLLTFVSNVRPHAVIHLAALASVGDGMRYPSEYWNTNTDGTINLIRACGMVGTVRRLVFASSGGTVYGKVPDSSIPIKSACPTVPEDLYGYSKLAGENLLRILKVAGMDCYSLRFPSVYGPRQDPYGEAGVVAIFGRKMLDGQATVINGTGEQTRDFMYVGDVAKITSYLATGDVYAFPGSYNIGTGIETSVNEIWVKLANLTGYTQMPEYAPAKDGEVMRVALKPDIAVPGGYFVDINSGLAKTVEFLRNA